MTETDIQIALQKHLAGFAKANSLRVAVILQSIAPKPNETYLAEYFMPARTINPVLDASIKRYIGIYQVDVVMVGSFNSVSIGRTADAVIDHFKAGLKLGNVVINGTPSRGPVIVNADQVKIPITINYTT